jgi:predicted DNA-binding antitoxin AbrB/MazE fold protein
MSQRIDAIYVNGIFQPQSPVDLVNGQHVSLNIESSPPVDDWDDLKDMLDHEFMAACRLQPKPVHTLAEVRQILSAYPGSLAEMISAERDER